MKGFEMYFRKSLMSVAALSILSLSACKSEGETELQKLILEAAVQAEVETAKEEAKYLDLRGQRLALEAALVRKDDLKIEIGTVIDMDENNRIVEAKVSLMNTEMDEDPFYINWYKLEKKGDSWVALHRDLIDEDWIVDKTVEELPLSYNDIKTMIIPHLQETIVLGTMGEQISKEEQTKILSSLILHVTRSGLMFERLAPFVEITIELEDERFVGKKYRYVFDEKSDGSYHLKYKPVLLPWVQAE